MPQTLLLADDSVTIQRVIDLTFADEDIRVAAVSDGDEAVRRILADRPDIVLADVNLPARDGYQLSAFVKDDPALQHIPVLLLTGAFEPFDQARLRAVRCDGVLSKPFDPQVLITRVKELLGHQAPAAPEAVRAGIGGADMPGIDEQAPMRDEDRLDLGALSLQPGEPAGPESSLDEYFDRLDAAFASLTGSQPAQEGDAQAGRPAEGGPESPGGVPASDAFAAMLDAEHTLGPEGARAARATAPAAKAAPVVDAAFIDDLARRVAARIGESALREAVAPIVSAIAERMVREEIDRIKKDAR
jgi:CheY-like chemotaxis protein